MDLTYLVSLNQYTQKKIAFDENIKGYGHEVMELFQQIYTLPKVVIAQVQGSAIAGGCGLATVCDLVVSADEAKFGYSEVKIGFIPAIVSVFLIKQIGVAKSKELLLTGKIISAQEAEGFGLINQISKKEKLENRRASTFCWQASIVLTQPNFSLDLAFKELFYFFGAL